MNSKEYDMGSIEVRADEAAGPDVRERGRGLFPAAWGDPPTFRDSPERREWILRNVLRDEARKDPHKALRRADMRLKNILRLAELDSRRNGPQEAA